jgi:hypothetical protein
MNESPEDPGPHRVSNTVEISQKGSEWYTIKASEKLSREKDQTTNSPQPSSNSPHDADILPRRVPRAFDSTPHHALILSPPNGDFRKP